MALEGKIERDEMSKKVQVNKNTVKMVSVTLGGILLVIIGVVGTLKYQGFINSVKAQGIAEYKQEKCDNYSKEGNTWWECEAKRAK